MKAPDHDRAPVDEPTLRMAPRRVAHVFRTGGCPTDRAFDRFLPDEHVSVAHAAYERFALYQPRAGGRVGFTSGPKIAHFDRVEWLTLDSFSAMAALRSGSGPDIWGRYRPQVRQCPQEDRD